MELFKNGKSLLKTVLIIIAIVHFGTVKAQREYKITGTIVDINNQPISYANITMRNYADSLIISGTISNENGTFEITNNKLGSYLISASFIGYLPNKKTINVQTYQSIDLGEIILHSNTIELGETVVIGERLKAKQQLGNTIYYVNKKMRKASSTGIDLIKYIPGINVDIFHNISLGSSQNIIIQVNGIERDASFLNQLNSDDIDKIEVNNNPGVKYRSEVSGVINIILKENKNKGISGHFYVELPTRFSEVYSFPSASINYSFKKATIYASYNGAYSYFDIEAVDHKKLLVQNNLSEILNIQHLQQKNWSHKFHFGLDYFLNKSNQLNFYCFINPYSNEQDGIVTIKELFDDASVNSFHYNKDEKDKNRSLYASLYYKHLFSNPKRELIFDINYYNLQAQNSTFFSDHNTSVLQISNSEPYQNSLNSRLNFSLPLNKNIILETGLKQSLTFLRDNANSSFNYNQMVSAAYALATYTNEKFQINGGIRMEYAHLNIDKGLNKTLITKLPNINIKYDLSKKNNLKLAYQKQITRPTIYQLNPNLNTIDKYSTQKGNPYLYPVISQNFSFDYSTSIKNNFISAGVFYVHSSNVIENMKVMSDSLLFKKETQNLGNLSSIGIKMLGSIKLHKKLIFNPFIKLYHVQTQGNELAIMNSIENKSAFALESGLSMVFLFKHDVTLSALFKYNSSITKIQSNYAEDALYFFSLEKLFFKKLKVGITSALPLKKEFTYQRNETTGNGFSETSEDNIRMSAFPIWFKLKYSFASGKKVIRIKRTNDFKDNKEKKGF